MGNNEQGSAELVDILRNGLAVAGTFYQKKECNKITYRSGRQKTELDLLLGAASSAQEGAGLQSVDGRVCPHKAQTGRL